MRIVDEWLIDLRISCEKSVPNFKTVHLIDGLLFVNALNSGLKLDPKFDEMLNGEPYSGISPYAELIAR